MSQCVFIAADCPLSEVRPSQDYPRHFNVDTGVIYDSSVDDDYCLLPFHEVDIYCKKKYGVSLELDRYTEGRANQIIDYIKAALLQTDSVELWNVWLLGYWEFDDRPYIHKRTVRIDELTVYDIREMTEAENWNNKDKNRPSFYCIEVVRQEEPI